MTQEITLPIPELAVRRPRRRLDVGGATATGRRSPNEDHMLVWRSGKTLETSVDRLSLDTETSARRDLALGIVCDGLGGHGSGDIASALIVRHLFFGLRHIGFSSAAPCEVLADLLQEAHEQLKEVAQHRGVSPELGSTATVAWLDESRLSVAHVGDSRLYRFRDGALQQLTRDQTLAQRMREVHDRNDFGPRLEHVLWSAVGTDQPPHVDLADYHVQPGDVLLLCSDGVSGALDDDALIAQLGARQRARSIARALVHEAHAQGGTDDATAVVIHV